MQHLHLHLLRPAHRSNTKFRATVKRRPPLASSVRTPPLRGLDAASDSFAKAVHGAYFTTRLMSFQRFLEKIRFRFLTFWYHAHMRKIRQSAAQAQTTATRALRERCDLTRSISIKPFAPDYERWRRVVGKLQERHPTLKMTGIFKIVVDTLEASFNGE